MANEPKDKSKDGIAHLLHVQNFKGQNIDDVKKAISPAAIAGVVEQMYPGMGQLLSRIAGTFGGDPKSGEPKQSGPQSHISEGAKQKFEDIFKDKENLDPEELSAAVSKELSDLEDQGIIKFPSDAAKREFMNSVSNSVYGAEEGKRVAAVAKTAFDYAKEYGVDVEFGVEDTVEVDAKPVIIAYDANQEVPLTQTQLLDITPHDTGGWMNTYKMDADGHMVEQGNVRIAEVMQGVGINPTITLLTAEGDAVNTEELVGHEDMPGGAFAALKGEDGTTYYTDLSSLPGLGTDKGQNIWNKMQQETPEVTAPGPSTPSPSMTQRVGAPAMSFDT